MVQSSFRLLLGYSHICDLFFKPWVRLLTFSATPKVETVETTHLNLDSSITLTSGTHVQQRFMKLPQLSRLSETLATAADTVVAGAFWSHAQLLQIPKESKSSWPKALQRTSLGQIALPILSKPHDSGLGFGWSVLKHLKTYQKHTTSPKNMNPEMQQRKLHEHFITCSSVFSVRHWLHCCTTQHYKLLEGAKAQPAANWGLPRNAQLKTQCPVCSLHLVSWASSKEWKLLIHGQALSTKYNFHPKR